jgi:protein-tyrosine phosphatase
MGSHQNDVLRVVFVCTGNRARSPLAEALFRRRIDARRIDVASFGTLDAGSQPPLADAIAVGDSLGVDLRAHRSRRLEPGCLADADLVVGFESSHVDASIDRGGADPKRVFMLLELHDLLEYPPPLVEVSGSKADHARSVIGLVDERRREGTGRPSPLRDPYGEPRRVFAETARVIDAAASLLAASVFPTFTQSESSGQPALESGSLAGRLLGRVRRESQRTDR